MLDYPYFKEHYKLIAVDLSKQQELNADPKANQRIFTGNLGWAGNTTMFLIIDETKETVLNFSEETVKLFWMCSTILFFFNKTLL